VRVKGEKENGRGKTMESSAGSYCRFLAGDESGLVEIIRDYRDGLILYLYSFTGDLRAAEELAEDTFVKLAVKRPRDKGGASFKTWLYAIGRNLALDHLRRSAARREAPLEAASARTSEAESLEQRCLRTERQQQLRRAMARLKPEYRQVLWLVYFEDFSLKDAARVMKKSTHAAETLVYRARQALKAEWIKEGFDDEEL